jgi:hypothetical protein
MIMDETSPAGAPKSMITALDLCHHPGRERVSVV